MLLAQNPSNRPGNDSRQFTSHSQRNHTAGGSILKRKNTDLSMSRDDTTQPADYLQGQMFSIQEHDNLAHSKGDIRQSSMNLDPLDESLRDPRIGIQRIEGLTDFLMDEYRKRLGIYTQDSKKLIKFWKDYVSVIYKNKRVDTLKKKYASNLQGDFDYEFDKTTPLSKIGMSDLSNDLGSGLGPNSQTMFGRFKSKKTRTLESAKTTFQSNLDQAYDQFGSYYEQDVIATIEKDIADQNDSKNQEKLAGKKKQLKQEKDDKNRREQAKIQRSLQVYFSYKQLVDLQAHSKVQESKKLTQAKEDETKKLEDAKTQKQLDQIKKSQEKLSKLNEKPRNPNFESGQARLAAPGAKSRSKSASLKRGNVMPAHNTVRRQPNLGSPTKEQITHKKPEKLIALEKKYPEQSKKVQESYKKDHDDLQKLLFLIASYRAKMTNNIREMTNTFIDAQEDSENKFGRDRLEQLFKKYMSPQEQALRLSLYRTQIQPSKRRAEVTLLDFYISCSDQERALHLFEIDNFEKAKEEIANFEKQEAKEKQAVTTEKEERLKRKEQKYQTQVKKDVFGDNFDETKNQLILKNRPDYTKPKDKWKLGKELKALQKMFPHDRVVQRMVEETFRTNQVFKYPEEYDIYNEAVEQSLKKNFGRGQTEKGEFAWKIPDFKGEASKIENFKQRDIYQKREHAARMREIIADEEALEGFLVQKAHEYHSYMAERAKAAKVQAMGGSGDDKDGFQKSTLRDTLARYYQEMLLKHTDLAKQRFHHISYGQDPNSETFKKSFPLSFKRYFFKLVKSIIVGGRGTKKLLSKPLSLVLTVGAKEPKIEDGFAHKTQNIRLQKQRFGQQLRALKTHKPQTWRTRVFKRQDLKKRLEKVFMQYSEVENCTFEPEAGSLHPNWKNIAKISKEERFRADTVPGEYFNRMGDNFCKSNPALYKKGKFKKAMTNWTSGKYQEVLNILCEGFDLTKLCMHYRAHQFKVWNDYRQEEKKDEKLKNEKQKAKPDDKAVLDKKKEETQKNTVIESDDLDPDQIRSIREVFDKYDIKKEDLVTKKIQAQDQMKFKDLDDAMRACGITPQAVEISEYGKKMDTEGKKYISFQDFLKLMTKKLKDSESQKDLIKAFKILDFDKSGSIDTEEFVEIFMNLNETFSKEEIQKMVKLADTNKDGSISQEEFIQLMHHKRDKFKGNDILTQLKLQLKRYIHKQELKRQFKVLPAHVVELLDYVKDKVEQEHKLHPEKKLVYIEDFQSAQLLSIYDDCWGLFEKIMAQKEEAAKKKVKSTQQQLELERTHKILKEQIEEGGDEANIGDEEGGEKDFRKVFKTIMCPLKLDCPKVKMLRWPSSSIKSSTKFGKDCPYAHHPMELQFPQTLEMRIGANKKTLKELGKGLQERPKVFRFTGDLYDCQGCGGKCNLCAYKRMAQDVIDKTAAKLLNKTMVNKDQIMERKEENDKQRDLFAKKFGILKKASVLMFYGRVNDAFDEIAKAADIIKKQHETQKEQELNLQKRWQFKLGLNEGFELPRPIEKIRPEDVTDEFLKSIDAGSANIATLKLYIQNVCPLIRSQYNRDTFLNGLITDLYYECEDQLLKKKQNIDTIAKNVEKLNEIQEILEGLGSDVENPPDDLEDNDGNPIKLPKKKRTMCENVQKKKLYKDEGIEMKTDGKYYVDRKYTKTVELEHETQTIKCTVCKNGKNCKHAHNAIELDLAPLSSKIKNLQVVVKSEKYKLQNDKPLEPWRPAARNFENKVEEPQKIVKGEEEEGGDDKKVKRKGILERENVFRKPWDKE